jgi:cytochrome bd-type quinol oxidase subunit 1
MPTVERRQAVITKQDLVDAFEAHTNDEMPKIKLLVEEAMVETKMAILDAFPAGDVHAHRMAHEQMMKAAAAEQAFWDDLKKDIAKKSIWGILQILILLVFGSALVKLGLGAIVGLGK